MVAKQFTSLANAVKAWKPLTATLKMLTLGSSLSMASLSTIRKVGCSTSITDYPFVKKTLDETNFLSYLIIMNIEKLDALLTNATRQRNLAFQSGDSVSGNLYAFKVDCIAEEIQKWEDAMLAVHEEEQAYLDHLDQQLEACR
jgi:hypothetical protein